MNSRLHLNRYLSYVISLFLPNEIGRDKIYCLCIKVPNKNNFVARSYKDRFHNNSQCSLKSYIIITCQGAGRAEYFFIVDPVVFFRSWIGELPWVSHVGVDVVKRSRLQARVMPPVALEVAPPHIDGPRRTIYESNVNRLCRFYRFN